MLPLLFFLFDCNGGNGSFCHHPSNKTDIRIRRAPLRFTTSQDPLVRWLGVQWKTRTVVGLILSIEIQVHSCFVASEWHRRRLVQLPPTPPARHPRVVGLSDLCD